jgi:hypothetical protein
LAGCGPFDLHARRIAVEIDVEPDEPTSHKGMLLHGYYDGSKTYLAQSELAAPGGIESVEKAVDAQQQPALELHLTPQTQQRIAAAMQSLIDHHIALVLDGRTVLVDAVVREALLADEMLLSGGDFTTAEVDQLLAAIYPPLKLGHSVLVWLEDAGLVFLLAAVLILLGIAIWRVARYLVACRAG